MKTDKTRKEVTDALSERYDTVTVMAEGEGKTVIQIRHRKTGRPFIIKSFEGGAPVYEFLSGIECEGLPRVCDVIGCSDGSVVIEEFINGTLLSSVMRRGPMKYKEARKIILRLCGILAVLHENGFVHRDVKPENIMISDKGELKLIDFDAARVYDTEKTSDTRVLGTVGYASPEQFGMAQSDCRSDIYALGVLLNELITGAHPSEQVAHGRAGRIVLKCTQINPDLRYQTVEKLAEAL